MEKSRRMIYPYTFTAKVMQFPYKFYFNNNALFKGWVIGSILLLPVMYKIQKAVNSPANVEKAEARKRREHEELIEHLKHRY